MTDRDTEARRRTITWSDPERFREAARSRGGLRLLEAQISGEIPQAPIAELMNFALAEVSEGRAVVTGTPEEYHYNPIGIVHGGFAATLIDSATGMATMAALPEGARWTTLELKVTYVRAMTKDTGTVRCEASVVHKGSRVVTSEARLVDAAGKLYAHGTATCLVLDRAGA